MAVGICFLVHKNTTCSVKKEVHHLGINKEFTLSNTNVIKMSQ